MEKDGGLTKGNSEMIVITISGHNKYTYCDLAQGTIACIRDMSPNLAEQLTTNSHKADITSKKKVKLNFVSR